MAAEYSVEICNKLQEKFQQAQLHRPMQVSRYEPGSKLVYDVTAVGQANTGRVHLIVDKFVGGGFAGQVYKVKMLSISKRDSSPVTRDSSDERRATSDEIDGLKVGRVYAMKILVPPSGFSHLFRNLLYWVGFQGPFQLQVNPTAARAAALWQKFIRRAAKIRFGDENAVVDIYATFIDEKIGSCGELSEWIDGRTWRLEVDDRLDLLSHWRHTVHRPSSIGHRPTRDERSPLSRGQARPRAGGGTRDEERETSKGRLGSPEYRAKYEFMHKFVELLHDMGAYELARQYEWSTAKSQPNCLKRQCLASAPVAEAAPATGAGANPSAGLVAVDFKAGLVLLPFLPMSPGDFKLIVKGVMRGSLVQFDRGSIEKLAAFVQKHGDEFADMRNMLEELKTAEQVYRNSVPDITHNHICLLYSRQLWSTILDSAITGWKVQNLVDQQHKQKLLGSRVLTLFFYLIGLIPPLRGFLLKIWGRPDWRKHYWGLITSWGYLQRAVQARIAEKVIVWHRAGRVDGERALKTADEIWRFFCHLPISVLPTGLHRFLTDRNFRREKLAYIFVRPIRLYFNAELRQQWLREMMTEGQKKNMLSDEDAKVIISQINEPFIQKYLISLVVHLCTLPASEITWVICAFIYWLTHRGQPHTFAVVAGIVAAFQVVPISPGSLMRGLYVLYLVIKERNFKDYNIAVFLGFFKYIGYLAFPIQMAYRYPVLARFMASHWATEVVHIVPVFGENGALLEHWTFRLFYNWPLTIRRRMRKRAEIRASIKPRYWHVGLCAVVAAGIFGLADFAYRSYIGQLPALKDIWWLIVAVPLTCGAAVTLGCGGAVLWKRVVAATICGVLVGILYIAVSAMLGHISGTGADKIMTICLWRAFIFTILSTIGAVITELKLPDPVIRGS